MLAKLALVCAALSVAAAAAVPGADMRYFTNSAYNPWGVVLAQPIRRRLHDVFILHSKNIHKPSLTAHLFRGILGNDPV